MRTHRGKPGFLIDRKQTVSLKLFLLPVGFEEVMMDWKNNVVCPYHCSNISVFHPKNYFENYPC